MRLEGETEPGTLYCDGAFNPHTDLYWRSKLQDSLPINVFVSDVETGTEYRVTDFVEDDCVAAIVPAFSSDATDSGIPFTLVWVDNGYWIYPYGEICPVGDLYHVEAPWNTYYPTDPWIDPSPLLWTENVWNTANSVDRWQCHDMGYSDSHMYHLRFHEW